MGKTTTNDHLRVLFDDDDRPEVVVPLTTHAEGGAVTHSTGEEFELERPSGKAITLDFQATSEGKKPPQITLAIVEAGEVTVALRCRGACGARIQTRHGEFLTVEYGDAA